MSQSLPILIIALLVCAGLIAIILLNPAIPLGGSLKGKHLRIPYWAAPLLGALALLFSGLLPIKNAWEGLTGSGSINPLKILVLFISMTTLSIFLDEAGMFRFLAGIALRYAKTSQVKLFLCLYLLVAVLTVFTSNDIIILTFTPFIISFCKKSKISPIPYLFMEFISANTMSMALIIGNPTNIYLGTSFNITFVDYFNKMFVPSLIATITSFIILLFIFKNKLKVTMSSNDEEIIIRPNRMLLAIGISILLITTILLAISSYIGLEMYIIALIGAGIELIFLITYSLVNHNDLVKRVLKHIPYNLLPFILSMVVIVLCLNEIKFSDVLMNTLNQGNTVFTYGFSGLLTANIINNIPMSIFYQTMLTAKDMNAIYASIAASNIAAYLTPLGALAGLMFISLCKKGDVQMDFLTFSKYGLVVGLPAITVTLLYINFVC